MSNYHKRVDANQTRVVAALRKAGATVQHLHAVGHGCPDLLVGYHGHTILMEVKDGNKPPSKRELTDDEKEWMLTWKGGYVFVVLNPQDAVFILPRYKI